jgi:L-seryl-tRNA(Ser) seleniumtransferase
MDLKPSVNSDPRRGIPSMDRLIQAVADREEGLPLWAVKRAAQDVIDELRRALAREAAGGGGDRVSLEELADRVVRGARALARPHPRGVINATGILLHTNLGRAPLAPAARAAVEEAARGYSNLELDLASGRRGSRLGALEAKLVAASGAEAAHVVNNCAAAVLLALNSLALGRSVVISRGELVEIGGSFRVPAIMERAGVRLVEVGTTNRTHLRDYEQAIAPDTALLLKVHRSNFEQRGFVAEPELAELARLAHRAGLPLVEDLGSGTLLDLGAHGLPAEAWAPARLRQGADLVCFSADKLLGGPQAGIVLGKREIVRAMRDNPLARALRVDKLTLAALDATLDLMLDEERAGEIPLVAGLRASAEDLEARARRLCDSVEGRLRAPWSARVEQSEAAIGGGSVPDHRLASAAVVLSGGSAGRLAEGLRHAPNPVLARVRDDELWLDVRALLEDELASLVESLEIAFANASSE